MDMTQTQKYGVTVLLLVAIGVSHYCSFSFFVGSHSLHISPFLALVPLIGSLWGVRGSVGFFGFWGLYKYIIRGAAVTAGIPTALATLSWTSSQENKQALSFLLHVLFPLTCMVIFCCHPVGRYAWPYAMYWFIPIVAYAWQKNKKTQSMIIPALQSTFVAHAAGSIMWLFLRPISPVSWLSLIPVVAAERLVLACMMVIAYTVGGSIVKYVFAHISKKTLARVSHDS